MYKISGVIIRGKNKGKKLGFPTANIRLQKAFGEGVFSGVAHISQKRYKAAIFVKNGLLEAHLLDFDGDLYGKLLEVEIGLKIREVMKFENDEDLMEQIKKDVEIIKELKTIPSTRD